MEQALPYLLAIAAIILLWGSHKQNRKRRLIGNLPTSKTQGLFIGLVETTGTAECERPLTSFLAEIPCVTYSYSVSEQWRRTVQETYTDEKGNRRTRTRVETGWATVASGGQETDFYLEDDTGVVLVRPAGAEIRPKTVFNETCGPTTGLYYQKAPPIPIPNSTFIRTFTESAIPLHQKLFIVGQSREREDMVAPELAHDNEAPLYLMTVENEAQVLRRYGWNLHLLNFFGAAVSGIAGWMLGDQHFNAPEASAAIGEGIFLVLWSISWCIMVYNSLVDVRNRVRQGWSNLEVQLKRRHELIPQLVTIVTAATGHEAGTHTHLATLRSQAQLTDWQSPNQNTHSVSKAVVGLREGYPDLHVNENFMQLSTELIATEQRIALARSYFNDIATAYNTRLEHVPDKWVASLGAFPQQPLLFAEDFERARVDVKLVK